MRGQLLTAGGRPVDAVFNVSSEDLPLTLATQSTIGEILYPRSSGEILANVNPTFWQYVPGDVRRYGAVGDGDTDCTTAFQQAINASSLVIFPEGNFSCSNFATLASDTAIRGAGIGKTRITKAQDTTQSRGVLYAQSESSTAFIENVTISGIEFVEPNNTFSEFQHLVSFNGVRHVLVTDCRFTGFRGDGIYVGSQDGERHNERVSIVNCVFDGVNNDNRNAISVIDCDGLVISENHFVNCTRSNMPGAVDIEPNAFDYQVNRNVTISNNTFKNCGGNVANIGLVLSQTTFTEQPENFSIFGNVFDGVSRAVAVLTSTTYARPLNVSIFGNSGKVGDFLSIGTSVDGVSFSGNSLYGTGRLFLGFNDTDTARSVVVADNTLVGDGTNTRGVVIRGGEGISITGNTFDGIIDYCVLIGGTTPTADNIVISGNTVKDSDTGVEFSSGTLTNISITDNNFSGTTSPIQGTIPAGTQIANNVGYVTENQGLASVSSGATVAHGLAGTPEFVSVTSTTATPTDIFVNAANSTTFTVNFTGGGSGSFYWHAKTANA